MLSPRKTQLSLLGNKGASQCDLPRPSSSQNPKGNQFLPGNLLALRKHPTLCFCTANPPAAGLTPSRCHRAPPEVDHLRRSKLSLPLLPPCNLPTHPSLYARSPASQAWQCASSPDGPHHPTVNPALRRGEEKANTSLTVAPAVGWGQTSGLTVAHPLMQVIQDSTGEVPCSSAPLQRLSKMTKWNNPPQNKLQEVVTANELIKTISQCNRK